MKEEKKDKIKKGFLAFIAGFSSGGVAAIIGGMFGYGMLHYINGLTLMSSPENLINSFYMSAAIGALVFLLMNHLWNRVLKEK